MNKNNRIVKLTVSLLLVSTLSGCLWGSKEETTQDKGTLVEPKIETTASGLQYIILEPAKDAAAKTPAAGDKVTVDYTGWLFDDSKADKKGKKFDSSVDRGQKFSFFIGKRQVIGGWDEGVMSMKVGEKRRLIIPAGLAYGQHGIRGVIPGGATLVFDVELHGINS